MIGAIGTNEFSRVEKPSNSTVPDWIAGRNSANSGFTSVTNFSLPSARPSKSFSVPENSTRALTFSNWPTYRMPQVVLLIDDPLFALVLCAAYESGVNAVDVL